MKHWVRYQWACGCRRDWTDGTTKEPDATVTIDTVCDNCRRAADRKRAELRRLYGRTISKLESGKRRGVR